MKPSRPEPLAPRFAAGMAPLALLAGIIIGVLIPWLYEQFTLGAHRGEATAAARQVAAQLDRIAQERPRLWAYDEARLKRVAEHLVQPPVGAFVQMDIATPRRPIERRYGHVPAHAVGGWAVVRSGGRSVARVQVQLSAAAELQAARRLWIIAGLFGALLAAGLFFLPVRTVRQGDARDQELWDALEEANARLEVRVAERTAELRQLSARLVAIQEEERQRISRDLHDELGQTLTGLRLRLTMLEQERPSPHLDAALAAIDAGVEQVRNLAHGLRPPALDELGLVAALKAHAESWSETAGLELSCTLEPAEPGASTAEVLFRVAQEALTNVARHAEAERVWLTLESADDGWRLTVEDDGRGLPPELQGGLGLIGARERVEAAEGYLDLETGAAGGLRLLAWLPAQE